MEENTICVLEFYLNRFIVCLFTFRYDTYFDFDENVLGAGQTKAEAIIKYDISGCAVPFYDNTGNLAKCEYSPDEIGSMCRIR